VDDFYFCKRKGIKLHTDIRKVTPLLTRVNSANVQDEGLRIGGIGRWMNLKVKVSRNKCISRVNLGVQPGLLSICPTPSPPGPYI
jgi:hypothetical protein